MGWGQEGKDDGSYVVAAVVNALAEQSNGVGVGSFFSVFEEGYTVTLVDDVENEIEDGGEARRHKCELSAGCDSNRLVEVGRNNVVGIGRDGELVGFEFLLERVLEL